MFRIVVTTDRATFYAKNPDDTVFSTDHALEAEAFADLWLIGQPGVRSVSLVRESWPATAARLRADLAAGLPLPTKAG